MVFIAAEKLSGIEKADGGGRCSQSRGVRGKKTKLMPGRIMVMLVCTGALLGAVGIYGPFSKWAGAGANVPLLGFGNVLWKGMKQAIDEEGAIGLFKGGFTACAVGVSSALIFSYIASLLTKPKMKR